MARPSPNSAPTDLTSRGHEIDMGLASLAIALTASSPP